MYRFIDSFKINQPIILRSYLITLNSAMRINIIIANSISCCCVEQ